MRTVVRINQVTATLLHGDCLDCLAALESESVDLIMTSPPYANQRRNTYGGIAPDAYVSWFLPRAKAFHRVLKPTGTFMLNIREHVEQGERHPYVLELILALKAQGWLWTEEYIWHKKNPMPGKWPNRFKNAWERLLQFNKQRHFHMYQDSVMEPVAENTKAKFRQPTKKDQRRIYSSTGSGVNIVRANFLNRQWVYPSNVLHLAVESGNQGHSAVFPLAIPSWFIRLFTQRGDVVLDPFMGSGTTCVAAVDMERHTIGVDAEVDYLAVAQNRLHESVRKK
jgi:DNA modification methylase